MIFSKLQKADDRYREIEQMMTLPEVVGNNKKYAELAGGIVLILMGLKILLEHLGVISF